MKRNLLIAFLALLLTGGGILGFFYLSPAQPADIAITVNGTPISEAKIQERIRFHTLRNQAFETVLEHTSDKDTLLQKVSGPTDREQVKRELIKGQVIRDALLEYDGPFSYEQTAKAADSEWEQLTVDDSQESFYLALLAVLEQKGVTTQEYQQYSRDFAYDFYNTTRLKQAYQKAEHTLTDSFATPEEQFSAYVDSLMIQAEVTGS